MQERVRISLTKSCIDQLEKSTKLGWQGHLMNTNSTPFLITLFEYLYFRFFIVKMENLK